MTVLDLPSRWDELDDPTRLRLQIEGEPTATGKVPLLAVRVREEPIKALGDQCDLATAEAFARAESKGSFFNRAIRGRFDCHALLNEHEERRRRAVND